MGIETIAIIGLSLLQADSAVKSAEAEAQAVVDQAGLETKNKAQQVQAKAAAQQTSFLNSGLTLDGTPMSAIQATFSTGLEDLELIESNANSKSKQIISNSRMETLSSLGSMAMGTFGGGDFFGGSSGSGFLGSQGTVSRTIEFGSANAQGPIQGFGGFGG